jgi:hypothetical protein
MSLPAVRRDPAADAWYRYDHGCGPAPRCARPSALDKVRVCDIHGTILWRGQACPDCKGS